MYLADYHVHSRISPDASASMQEMAEAAIRLGFQEICFTDHVEPIRFGTTEPRGAYDWDPMIAEFRAARTAVGDRITLRLGAELGDAVWGIRRMESMLAEAPPLDFLIGSIHTLSEKMEGRDLYFLTPRDEQEARDCLADYLGQVRKLAEWGRFQVLGHLTLPLRYLNENRGMHVSFDGFEEEIAEIFRLIIPKGIGIELNTNRGNTPLPDEKWLRLYRSLGGEIVTLGTDAHTPGFVGCAVREGQAVQGTCTSEVVESRARMEELLALWRGLEVVDVLSLPSLDVVCVEYQSAGGEPCAALFFADKLDCHSDFLRLFFADAGIKKAAHGVKELCRALLEEGIAPAGFVFDTQVAAYLLAPTDGSYELEKLGITYYNQEFPKAEAYLSPGAFGPLADPVAPTAALDRKSVV